MFFVADVDQCFGSRYTAHEISKIGMRYSCLVFLSS